MDYFPRATCDTVTQRILQEPDAEYLLQILGLVEQTGIAHISKDVYEHVTRRPIWKEPILTDLGGVGGTGVTHATEGFFS